MSTDPSDGADGPSSASPNHEQNPGPKIAGIQAVTVRSAALSGILLLLCLYTMYFAAGLLKPIAVAFLLSLVLNPVVRGLTWLRVPQTLAALLVMLTVAGVMVAAIYALTAPATEWMDRAPTELRKLEGKLSWVKEPIEKVRKAKEQVQDITDGESSGDSSSRAQRASPAEQNSKVPPGVDSGKQSNAGKSSEAKSASSDGGNSLSLVSAALNNTTSLLYGLAVMHILLFFVLASGDALLNKVVQVTTSLQRKKQVVETAREIQHHVAIYLATITVINILVGVVTAIGMYLIGMPNPLLWGVMLTVLNYIPYMGVAISMVIVTFVALLTFSTATQIVLPALIIFGINVVEGQFLTPIITGRRLALSPVAVFIAIAVLGWMWGLVGVLIAVPTLAVIKLVCEQVEPLEDVAVFLSRR